MAKTTKRLTSYCCNQIAQYMTEWLTCQYVSHSLLVRKLVVRDSTYNSIHG